MNKRLQQKEFFNRIKKLIKTSKEVKVYKDLGIIAIKNSKTTSIIPISLYASIK